MTPEDMSRIHHRAMSAPPPWSAATISGFLTAPGSILVQESDAFALGRTIADEAELLTIAVDPESQGRGLGRLCLRRFLDACRDAGADRVFLEVATTNRVARALYESQGFRQDGLRKGYYRASGAAPIDAVLMSRPLSAA